MKRRLKIFLLPITSDFMLLAIALSITFLISLIITPLVNYVTPQDISYTNIKSTELFINNPKTLSNTEGFSDIFPFAYDQEQIPYINVGLNLDFVDTSFNKDIMSKNLSQELPVYTQNDYSSIALYPNLTSKEVELANINNDTYSISYIVAGDYPENRDEVLINEYIAQVYMDNNDFPSYESIIGKNIDVVYEGEKHPLIISGVSVGNDNLVSGFKDYDYTPSYYGIYKDFDTKKSKEEYINTYLKNDNYNYIDSSMYNTFKVINVFKSCILGIIFLSITIPPSVSKYKIIRYYDKTYTPVLIFTIPFILLVFIFKFI